MSKDRLESIVAGVGALIFGIIVIIIGIAINDKIWFTISMTMIGTVFSVYACQYLAKIFKRSH